MYQLLFPFTHLFAVPALHGILVDGAAFVRYDKVFADAQHLAESLADFACSVGIVEVEHQVARFPEFHSVGCESLGKQMFLLSVGCPNFYYAFVMSLIICRFDRICQAAYLVFLIADAEPVYKQSIVAGIFKVAAFQKLRDVNELAFLFKTRKPFFEIDFQLLGESAAFGNGYFRQYCEAGSFRIGCYGCDNVRYAVAFHLFSAHRRICLAYACEKHTEIIVDFRGRSHCASRIAGVHFLFNGYGRRQAFYVVAFRLGHASEKLAGVCREAFHITSLAFGIKGVERQ